MGTIKLIFYLMLIGAVVYVGAELIPPYFANYEFQDTINNEARMGTYSTKGDDVIRDTVFKRAQDLDIPVTREEILVQRTGQGANGGVTIETDYTVHVDLPGYPMDLHFHPESKNKALF